MRIAIHKLEDGHKLSIWDDREGTVFHHWGLDYIDAHVVISKALEKWNAQEKEDDKQPHS